MRITYLATFLCGNYSIFQLPFHIHILDAHFFRIYMPHMRMHEYKTQLLAKQALNYSKKKNIFPAATAASSQLLYTFMLPDIGLQCVRDNIAFVFKLYTLFSHSLAA